MKMVSDTGPLIALAKADLLHLLNTLFDKVAIPPAVYHELSAKTGEEAKRLDAAIGDYIIVTDNSASPTELLRVVQGLGPGEENAIALAVELGTGIIIDDKLGRAAARVLDLTVTGTVGVLVEAKRAGLVSDIRSVLENMRSHGYYFSDSLIDAALRLATN